MKTTYEMDFYGWTEEQTHLLKQKDYSKVDWQNLIDEIESLGRSEKRSLTSLLTIYFMHLLKKKYQPNHDCRSWDLSIKNSHLKFLERLSENPSAKSRVLENK